MKIYSKFTRIDMEGLVGGCFEVLEAQRGFLSHFWVTSRNWIQVLFGPYSFRGELTLKFNPRQSFSHFSKFVSRGTFRVDFDPPKMIPKQSKSRFRSRILNKSL